MNRDDALLKSFSTRAAIHAPVVKEWKSLPATLFDVSFWSNQTKESWKNDAISLRTRYSTKNKSVEQGLEWVCLALAMPKPDRAIHQTLMSKSQLKVTQFWDLFYKVIHVTRHRRRVPTVKDMCTLYEVPKAKAKDADNLLNRIKHICDERSIPWQLEEPELIIACFVVIASVRPSSIS